jgi:hypothetical protein
MVESNPSLNGKKIPGHTGTEPEYSNLLNERSKYL